MTELGFYALEKHAEEDVIPTVVVAHGNTDRACRLSEQRGIGRACVGAETGKKIELRVSPERVRHAQALPRQRRIAIHAFPCEARLPGRG